MNKIIKSAITGFFLIGILFSCKKNDSKITPVQPQVGIEFSLNASGAPFSFYILVPNQANLRYNIEQLMFYIGYPRLIKSDSTEIPLTPLLLIHFDSALVRNAISGSTFSFSIPAGKYIGLKFGVGVPPAIRDTIAHYHFGNNDPLNRDFGMVWDMTLNNYRNIAITGNIDTSAAQNTKPNVYFTYHILDTDNLGVIYKDVSFSDAFTVNNNDKHTIRLSIDINKIFFNPKNPIDIKHNRVTDMSPGPQFTLGLMVKDNFCAAISNQ